MEESIKKTNQYELFKFFDGNRNIDSRHVKNLIDSIRKHNLLSIRPIIVDDNMNVIDGQHRLEAARSLGVDVYYFKINSLDSREVISLNQNNKNWKIEDFLKFHSIKNNNKNYLKILSVMNLYGWKLQDFFIYSKYNIRKISFRKDFENGLYIFDSDEEKLSVYYSQHKTFFDFCEQKKLEHRDAVNSLVFKDAFMFFCDSENIKLDQFWEKIRANPTLFHRCLNKDEYIDMFLKIYNHGVMYKIEKGML